MIKYIFFDVAGTLLDKPKLYPSIKLSIEQFGHTISVETLKARHKLLSEVVHFPDKTDINFYKWFNSELLYILGIVPTDELLSAIFNNCTYLPWEPFSDTNVLSKIDLPIGVISNFNNTLKHKLNHFFGPVFQDILVSEEIGVAKPKTEFYKKALEAVPYQADEILYIGDSIKLDFEPASALGFKVLIIDRDNFYPTFKNKITNLAEIKNFL